MLDLWTRAVNKSIRLQLFIENYFLSIYNLPGSLRDMHSASSNKIVPNLDHIVQTFYLRNTHHKQQM